MADKNDFAACAKHFVDANTDVIFYTGAIDRSGYDLFCDLLLDRVADNRKLLLVLNTYGGDPNAGYRIARAAIHHFGVENFRILIPGYCKSAGTLICIGATSLAMANRSELGPLDVQLRKQDELFQQSSGLDILRGVTHLREEALTTFRSYLISINRGSGLSTKVALEISSTLVIGLYQPLFEQDDPVKLGEMSAALQIAKHYGERLHEKSDSLLAGALNKLIMEYPTHGFVIDRSEARQLFKRVDPPSEYEEVLCNFVKQYFSEPSSSAIVFDYNDYCLNYLAPHQPPKADHDPAPTPEATAAASDAGPLHPPEQPRDQQHEHDGGAAQEHVEKQHPVGGEQGDA